jgi:hypothetical protein
VKVKIISKAGRQTSHRVRGKALNRCSIVPQVVLHACMKHICKKINVIQHPMHTHFNYNYLMLPSKVLLCYLCVCVCVCVCVAHIHDAGCWMLDAV